MEQANKSTRDSWLAPALDRSESIKFEERLRQLFDNTPFLIFSVDLEGRLTSANKATLEAYGYRADELPTVTLEQVIDKKHLSMARDKIEKRRLGDQDTTPYRLLTRHRDGSPIWLEIGTILIRDGDEPIGIQCVARNISTQREAERSLAESEQRFRETAELLPGVICEMDLEANLTYVNQSAVDLFGFTKEEVEKGVNAVLLTHPEDRERAKANLGEVMRGRRRHQTTYRLLHRDGTPIDMLVNSAPLIKNKRPLGMRACLLDIRDLRATERKLRKSEERFRRVFNESPIGVALADEGGRLTAHNAAFERMFGAEGEVVGLDIVELAELEVEAAEVLEAGRVDRRGWYTCRTTRDCGDENSDEERRFLEWSAAPLGDATAAEREILVLVQDVTERREAEEKELRAAQQEAEAARSLIRNLREQITERSTFHRMVSRSREMRDIFDILPQVSETDVTVMVRGESGTGKELIARSIHELSPRADGPFVAINCSALPDNLLESELFGYKAGAFTDAKKDKPGKFALAEGGTLFLDEIGDISPAMQVKLLRVLQEKVYEPLGATKSSKADVRIVAATNKDLKEEVNRGIFRQDLFYRINVLTIKLPPLRDRRSDIPVLCEHFVRKFNAQYQREINEVSQDALDTLLAYDFPGNIRELENVLEHAFVFCRDAAIGSEHLPREITGAAETEQKMQALSKVSSFAELEKLYIESILAETNGNKLAAAKRLGVHKTTFFRKLKKLGIES